MGICKKYCGVIPTLFGCFLWIPSLYVLSFFKCFFVTCFDCFFEGKSMVAVLHAACSYTELATWQYTATQVDNR